MQAKCENSRNMKCNDSGSSDVAAGNSAKELRWQQWAAKALFFVGGFGSASWAPMVPMLKERLALTEDVLGMLLLCVGIGSLATMPFSGGAAGKWGCRRVLVIAGSFLGLVLVLLSMVQSLYMLVPLILLLGAFMGAIDVVVNVLAVIVEKRSGRRLMSGMHAFWSVGGFAGAGIFSIWLNVGFNHFQAALIAWGIILAILAVFRSHLLADRGEKKEGSLLAIPRGIVVFIGMIAFVAFLVEGAVMDWSGVFLISVKHFELSMAGVGFTVFSAAMLLMRLAGDWAVNRLGGAFVTIGGGLLACAGFVLLILAPDAWLLYVGFFIIGIGSANIVPVFYSLMGRQKVMPLNQAVSAASTMGYLGILMGPALIGFVADSTNLYVSFGLLGVLAFSQAVIAKYVMRSFSLS